MTHVFTVTNESSSSVTYKLTLDLPEGWTSLPISPEVTLPPQGSKPIFVNVNVPEDTPAGKYEVTLTASSTDGTVEESETTYIQVESVPGFDLSWEREPTRPSPGTSVEGAIKIVNSGNTIDTYKVDISLEEGWEYSMEEEEVRLMAGQSTTLPLSFTIPEGAESGARYRIEVEVVSKRRPSLEKTLTATGSLAPPPPDRVTRTLYPLWDTVSDIYVDQRGDPSFYFGGRGEIPSLGEISANLRFDMEGVNRAGLRIMKENWGFRLGRASVSGSYLGVTGKPLFMGEIDDTSTKILFTQESKGISLDREGENWELRGVLASDTSEGFLMAELQGIYEITADQVVDGLITTVETENGQGTIIEGGIELSDDQFEFYPSFIRVSPGYRNQLPGHGYGVDVTWEEKEFTSSFYWDFDLTKLEEGGNSYTSSENRFEATTSLDLGENLNSSFSLGLTRRLSDDEPVSNDLISTNFSGSMEGGEFLNWSISSRIRNTVDNVSNTATTLGSISASIGFDIGTSEHRLSTTLQRFAGPTETNIQNSFSLTSNFPDSPLSPRFSLRRSERDTTVRINISETSPEDLGVNLSFSASVVQQDSFSLSLSTSFPDIFPFAGPTKGQVEGYLFIDENGNGQKDEGEQGIDGALLSLDNHEALSGEDGLFIFPPVRPGNYELEIIEIQSGLKPTVDLPRSVQVEKGEETQVLIPVQPRSWIRGLVFDDDNQNGTRDQGEPGMGGIKFSIIGEDQEKTIRSGSNGRFTIDLRPGNYQVQLQENSLPERYEPTTPVSVEVEAEKYGRTEVSFGVYQKPRPIEVTFGPPTAEFSYQPEEPAVGQEILLDGSGSSAIQTEIESYEWKLTHDETEITREGEKTRVRLDEPGDWKVTLTVTDKNGLKGQQIKTISVSG